MKNVNKILSSFIAISSALSPSVISANDHVSGNSFSDINLAGSWAKSEIEDSKRLGIFGGDQNGNFRPLDPITRQEVAAILVRALDLKTEVTVRSSFSDVTSANWGRTEIETVNKAGLMTGDGNGKFRPNDPITREELSVLLVRAAKLIAENDTAVASFQDKNQISAWAKQYVNVAYDFGLLRGDGTNFNPKKNAQRQEVATMFVNLHHFITASPVIEQIGSGNVTINGTTYLVTEALKGILRPENAEILKYARIRFTEANNQITKINYLEIIHNGKSASAGAGEFSGNLTFDGNNGTIDGDVKVTADYVSLKNITVTGNLEINERLRNDFYAQNINVRNNTYVNGGSSNTVIFDRSILNRVDINQQGVKVNFENNTTIGHVNVGTNATVGADAGITIPRLYIQDGTGTLTTHANISTIQVVAQNGATIQGTGKIVNLLVDTGSTINLNTSTSISNVIVSNKNSRLNLLNYAKIENVVLPLDTQVNAIINNFDSVSSQITSVNGTKLDNQVVFPPPVINPVPNPINPGSNNPTYNYTNSVVSQITTNSKEIKITFNREVNRTSAETLSNYTATLPGALTLGTPNLQTDKRSVILPINGGTLRNGDLYKIDVKNILDSNYNTTTDHFDTTKAFNDTAAPSVSKAEIIDDKLRLTFNEPVLNTMTIKLDGVVVASPGTLTISATPGEYIVETATINNEDLTKTGYHSVVVYNAQDTVNGTNNTREIQSINFYATKDTTPPHVQSISAFKQDQFKIKFNEELKAPGLTSSNLTISKGGYTYPASRIANIALDPEDLTKTTYIVTLVMDDAQYPLYGSGENYASLYVTLKNYTDKVNLVGSQYNASVQLIKDIAGPKIVANTLNSADNNTRTLTIKMDKSINATVDASKITVLDPSGVSQPITSATVNGTDNTKLDIVLNNALTTGVYQVRFAAEAVRDLLLNPNSQLTTTVNNQPPSAPMPIVAGNSANPGEADVVNNAITINYGRDMDNSAINLSYYKFDGSFFPGGTAINFLDGKQKVKITLPNNYFSVSTSSAITITKNVKTTTGLAVMKNAEGDENVFMLPFTDNVKPVLQTVQYLVADSASTSTDKIKLTFSEAMNTVSGASSFYDDFEVIINGSKQTLVNMSNVGSNPKSIVLTLSHAINTSQSVQVKVVPVGTNNATMSTTDLSSNILTEGTTLNVSGSVTQ